MSPDRKRLDIAGEQLGGKKPEGKRWKISEGKFAELRTDPRFKEMMAV